MLFPNTIWPCGGRVSFKATSTDPISEDFEITWDIKLLLRECFDESKFLDAHEKRMKSAEIRFADTSWSFFASFDGKRGNSLFGCNVRSMHDSPDIVFDCSCKISFFYFETYFHFGEIRRCPSESVKRIFFKFKYGRTGSHQLVKDFLPSEDLLSFLAIFSRMESEVSIRKLSVVEACSQTETTYPSKSRVVESFTQTQLPEPENEEEEPSKVNLDCKVCHDLKNLLLSGEDYDVTIRVRDQQFKAHRSILSARSPVFASMFRHDTKEKATGIVDVEDCEPSAFPILLEYLYCGSTEHLTAENVFGLYTAADKYDVQELKMKCLEFIEKNLSVETFCETVKLSLQHSESGLLKLTIDFFAKCFKKIIKTSEWQVFLMENPIQGNEIWIKALASDDDD